MIVTEKEPSRTLEFAEVPPVTSTPPIDGHRDPHFKEQTIHGLVPPLS